MAPLSLLGKYQTPLFTYGSTVKCAIRGEVVITKLAESPIRWPIGKIPGVRSRTLILYADLVTAVRRESVEAVAYHWGVTAQTVTKWRKALGIGAITEGTARLKSARAKHSPAIAEALKKAAAKAADPERLAKIAAARRGKSRPQHVIDAMREGRTRVPQSEEARQKIRETHLRRGTLPPKAGRPWSEQEEAMLGKMPDAVVAEKTGRKVTAVTGRRYLLRLAKFANP